MSDAVTAYCEENTINLDDRKWHDAWYTNSGTRIFPIYLPCNRLYLKELSRFLNLSEISRANRYHRKQDRERFIIVRGWLKYISAQHIGVRPHEVEFYYNPFGKPFTLDFEGFYFNVSHAGDYSMISFSNNPVGLDIETFDKDIEIVKIMEQVFSPLEISKVINSSNQIRKFYMHWTRKEAILKILGIGIDNNLKDLTSLNGSNKFNHIKGAEIRKIQVMNFEIKNLVGAIALPKTKDLEKSLTFHNLPEIKNSC